MIDAPTGPGPAVRDATREQPGGVQQDARTSTEKIQARVVPR